MTAADQSCAHADVLVAVAGPAQGRFAARMAAIEDAARSEVAALNTGGGIAGETVVLKTFEDDCTSEGGARAAQEIVGAHAALVLGHPCTRAALAAADVYGKAGALFIATATRHPRLTDKRAGETILRLAGRDDTQGASAGALLAHDHGNGRVAIIQDRTRYARTIAEGAASEFAKRTGKKPVIAAIIGGDKEYKATVAKTKSAEAVLFAGFPIEAGFVRAALRTAGSGAIFLGSDALATDEFSATFGDAAKDVRVLGAPGADVDTERFPALSETARTRAAVAIFAKAAQQIGSAGEAVKIAQALSAGVLESPVGEVRFNGKGDALLPAFAVLEWTGTAWRVVDATPQVAGSGEADAKGVEKAQ